MRQQNYGLNLYDKDRATPGFTLFSPLHAPDVYLLGMLGEVVHHWRVGGKRGGNAYLLPNGNLLAAVGAGATPQSNRDGMRRLQEHDWDGNVVWEGEAPGLHHDFRRLPNGDSVYIGYEKFTDEAAKRVQGGVPGSEAEGGVIYGDYVREIAPDGSTCWEWRTQEHMEIEKFPLPAAGNRQEFAHANSIFPMPSGDYMISFMRSSWVFIIDRATKKVRWDRNDISLGHHDFQMLENGNYMIFANGRAAMAGSRVVEFDPRTGEEVWVYQGSPPWSFYSPHISGAQRLWSGNTLICEGLWGRIFEVTPAGDIVWEYISPHLGEQHGLDIVGIGNWVFRAYRYAPDSPEIAGRVNLS